MKRCLFYLVSILLVGAGLGGCKPKHYTPSLKYACTLLNRGNVKMNVHIYQTYADYAASKNPLATVVIDSNNYLTLDNVMPAGKYYYIDCYSDSFLNTNWGQQHNPAPFVVHLTNADTTLNMLNGFYSTTKRQVYLDGDSTYTVWQAIDAIQYAGVKYTIAPSIWSSLSASQRYKQVRVNKGLTAMYSYMDAGGDTLQGTYGLNPDDTTGTGFSMAAFTAIDSVNFNFTGTVFGSINNYYGLPVYSSKDTIIGRFNSPDPNVLFIMAKVR